MNLNLSVLNIPECDCFATWSECFQTTPPTLNTLRRGFTSLIRYAFSDPKRFDGYEPALACLTYSSDPTKNQLSIHPGSTVDPGDTQNVPGILIKLDDGIKYETVGFSPRAGVSADFATHNEVLLGHATITLLCRNYDADICSVMGDMCMLFLASSREYLWDTWGWLRDYKIVSQSEPKLKTISQDDPTKWYEATCVIEIAYEYTTTVRRESKILKDYSLEPRLPM